MNLLFKIILIVVSSLLALAVLGFIGLQVKPVSFPTYPQATGVLEWFGGLEAPSKRIFTFDNAANSVAFEGFETVHKIMTETVLPETYQQGNRP